MLTHFQLQVSLGNYKVTDHHIHLAPSQTPDMRGNVGSTAAVSSTDCVIRSLHRPEPQNGAITASQPI